MTRKSIGLTILLGAGIAAVASGMWLVSSLMSCKYSESIPTYSADRKYYYQLQFTLCADRAKSRVRLMMGVAGTSDKYELLALASRFGEMHLSWHEGPKLLVQVPQAAIVEQFGPYAQLPQIEISNH
jgi:hypothetical protein